MFACVVCHVSSRNSPVTEQDSSSRRTCMAATDNSQTFDHKRPTCMWRQLHFVVSSGGSLHDETCKINDKRLTSRQRQTLALLISNWNQSNKQETRHSALLYAVKEHWKRQRIRESITDRTGSTSRVCHRLDVTHFDESWFRKDLWCRNVHVKQFDDIGTSPRLSRKSRCVVKVTL